MTDITEITGINEIFKTQIMRHITYNYYTIDS